MLDWAGAVWEFGVGMGLWCGLGLEGTGCSRWS